MRAGLVVTAVLGLAGCGGASPSGFVDRPASPGAARSADPPRLFVSPQGSDAGACTRARPCAGLARAFAVAEPGTVVEVGAGRYPEQVIAPRRASPDVRRVVVRPAPGARVDIERLVVEPGVAHLEVRDLRFTDGWLAGASDDGPPAEDLRFVRTLGSRFSIENARRVRVLGGSYGPSVDDTSQIKVANPGAPGAPSDILIEGVRFHDFTRSSDDVHTECLQVYAGRRVTVRGNRFDTCDGTGDLALTTLSSTRLRDVLVENNWFGGRGDAYFSAQLDESVEGLTFRYNSALKPVIFTACSKARCGSARVRANVMPFSDGLCSDRATYAYNVLTGGRCSAQDLQVAGLGFAAPQSLDLHLRPSSPAVCRGDPGQAPARDIDGARRLPTRRADAGADQVAGRWARSPDCRRR